MRAMKYAAAGGLLAVLIGMIVACQGLAQQSPNYKPEVWDKSSPAYNAPGAKDERAAETTSGAGRVTTDLGPTASAFPFGAIITLGLTNVFTLLTTIFQTRAKNARDGAIKEIHNTNPEGASPLAKTPAAKAIIAKIVGE